MFSKFFYRNIQIGLIMQVKRLFILSNALGKMLGSIELIQFLFYQYFVIDRLSLTFFAWCSRNNRAVFPLLTTHIGNHNKDV